MIRRTASEVLRSLEARVARLEGGRRTASTRTAAPYPWSLYEASQLMCFKYQAKFRHKKVYWKGYNITFEELIVDEFESKLDIDEAGMVDNIKCQILNISFHPGDGYGQEPTIHADMLLMNTDTGSKVKTTISMYTETDGIVVFFINRDA